MTFVVKRKNGDFACAAPPGPVQAPRWGFEWKPVKFIDGKAGTCTAPPELMTWHTRQGAKRFARMNGGKAKRLVKVMDAAKAAYLQPLSHYTLKREPKCERKHHLYGLLSGWY